MASCSASELWQFRSLCIEAVPIAEERLEAMGRNSKLFSSSQGLSAWRKPAALNPVSHALPTSPPTSAPRLAARTSAEYPSSSRLHFHDIAAGSAFLLDAGNMQVLS